ncbi:hypothetical protein [Deefgea sp. CFH1-16]|uniref:hypothetical protein n=1 Tax=Deefgea sp. CFH1-16 TaxID=2675457 RepID=UPI00194024F3|nr:hypothetical protein [Deefgea sp. CFH1-16]
MLGISLDTIKIRQTRFYYINVLFEFAQALFSKAGVLTKQNTFVASHCVDNGYIQLESLANLERPLIVINTTTEKIDDETLKPLRRFKEFFPNGFHVSGNKKSHFKPIVVNALDSTFNELNLEMNYLFLNGHGEKEYGTVSIAKKSATPEFKSTKNKSCL